MGSWMSHLTAFAKISHMVFIKVVIWFNTYVLQCMMVPDMVSNILLHCFYNTCM